MDDEKRDSDESKDEAKCKFDLNGSNFTKKMIETRVLIDAVHRRRCLWDRLDPEYRDRLAKDKAWKEICGELEPDFDSLIPALRHEISLHITKKWYNVRDSYVKSRRSNRSSRPYVYTNALSFLDPIYFADGSLSNTKHENYLEDKISNDDDGETSENWINEVFIDVDENLAERNNKKQRLDYTAKVKDEIDDAEANVVNILANLIQREEDDDRAFFKSVTPSVKMLSQEAKLEFRIQVLKLIKILRVKDKKGQFVKKEKAIDSESD